MVLGSYYCTLTSEFGLMHEGVVEMYREDDGSVKGTMIGTFFWKPTHFVDAIVEGDTFKFDAYFNTPCQAYTLHVEGRVDGDDLTADVQSTIGPWKLEGYRVNDSYHTGGDEVAVKHSFQRTLQQRKARI
ncbi:MAG: hypothetical protein IKH67_08045 [Lachnospiraceae bacterium]|nr:hypothetical protein [Lachnospiraceae bacterium]MBR3005000.1 hypothetical protein [Lachnospiraceae bacterium]MBR6350253.1 hypothetical protein [Lachnospiraceae bacterium]